ncbi:hypothetical protein [Lentzea sp. HUAS12]|uniref:hypothetical protein n=1 Tax=Lentzea sp. HUAS12 TaxID=2951806 RepID=UPI00209D292A|nr:hypothetical protein [Lentzea sp. HUAS12]USX53401.1 hypothetical protein ND450_04685 [Lentzea sp. HUAS12]
MNKALGYSGVRNPDPLTAPFLTSVKGHSPRGSEGGKFEAMMEVGRDQKTPALNLQGQTKNGTPLDIDHFDCVNRCGREIKMPLAIEACRGRVARTCTGPALDHPHAVAGSGQSVTKPRTRNLSLFRMKRKGNDSRLNLFVS